MKLFIKNIIKEWCYLFQFFFTNCLIDANITCISILDLTKWSNTCHPSIYQQMCENTYNHSTLISHTTQILRDRISLYCLKKSIMLSTHFFFAHLFLSMKLSNLSGLILTHIHIYIYIYMPLTVCPFALLIRHNPSLSLCNVFLSCCPHRHLPANHFSTPFFVLELSSSVISLCVFYGLKDHSLLTNITEITWIIHL